MFPLEQRKVIRGWQAHINAGLGGATDYEADYVPFKIPFTGIVKRYTGLQGGNWLRLTRPNGDKIELAHLSKYTALDGSAVEGQLGGITGNTGSITTGPHLHIQIFNKNGTRLDPEKYNWESLTKTFMKITIVANRITWDTTSVLTQLKEKFKTQSNNKFEPVFNVVQSNFSPIPLAPFLGQEGQKSVDINWYRDNVTPLGTGEATLFLMNEVDYNNGLTWGFMTYGDPNRPVRIEVSGSETDFVNRAFHEICHSLYFLTGQPDRTHELLYQPVPKEQELLNEIDYVKLQAKLVTIKPMEKIKIRQVGWSNGDPEKGLYIPFDTPATQAEIVSKINSILPKYELDTTKEYNLGKRPF